MILIGRYPFGRLLEVEIIAENIVRQVEAIIRRPAVGLFLRLSV